MAGWGTRLKLDSGNHICGEWQVRFRLFNGELEPSKTASEQASIAASRPDAWKHSAWQNACQHCVELGRTVCPRHSARRCTCDAFTECRCWHRTQSVRAHTTGEKIPPWHVLTGRDSDGPMLPLLTASGPSYQIQRIFPGCLLTMD